MSCSVGARLRIGLVEQVEDHSVRLRAGRAGSAKGAASMLVEAINTAVAAGADPATILVRGDSAYCAAKTVAAAVKAGARFWFTIARNPAVDAAIAAIGDEQFTPVHYPGAVVDPDTGQLVSDAQVAEIRYTVARGATLRTHLINIPARLARPQRRPVLHLPAHWPRAQPWLRLWQAVFQT